MQKNDTPSNGLNLFTDDNLEQWRQNCPSLQFLHLPDKCLLYRQGYLCPYVFLISQGIVKLTYITEQGNEWTIALLRRGDFIGRLPIDSKAKEMEENAQAVGEVEVFRLEHDDFKELLAHQSALLWQIFESQCIRRQQAERKLLDLLVQPVENRIVAMLKELADLFGKRCTHGYALEIRLTQQELADLVGASRPVVSTHMNNLRSHGMLDYTRELICVNDALFSDNRKQQ